MGAEAYLVELAVAAQSTDDRLRLLSALRMLAEADASLGLTVDDESGQILLKGISEPHIDAAIEQLRGTLRGTARIGIEIGAPAVAYRETLKRRVDKDYTYNRQTVGARQFARVRLVFAPSAGGGFESKVDDALPEPFVSAVAAGVASAMRSGIAAGFPVIDVKVTLIDGSYHENYSSAGAFETASRNAVREAFHEGGMILLEPVMSVEVTLPEDYAGFITGDILARRGQILRQEICAQSLCLVVLVPLANTFGYANQLRSGTQGEGSYSMSFSNYQAAPGPDDRGPAAPAVALRS